MLKVLIPVDGSPSSKNAVAKALTSNVLKDAEVYIISVIKPAQAAAAPSRNPYLASEMVTELGKANRQYAENVLEETKATIGSSVTVKDAVIREGNAAEEILKYAEQIGATLIVMGNRGLSTFNKIMLGSVSQKILTHSCCSVLIVKEC